MKNLITVLALIVLPMTAQAETGPRPLSDFPVWQKMEGLWQGELDYYDGDGAYRTRDYDGLFRIRIDGTEFHQQNWMYYGSQHANTAWLARGLARAGEGVELIVNTYGRAIDDAGTMQVHEIDHMFDFEGGERTRVISDTLVIYDYVDPETGILQHLQMVNLGVPDMRIRSSQGFDPNRFERDPVSGDPRLDEAGEPVPNPRFGKPRAASFYRETRIDEADFAAARAELRARHNVAVVVEAGATPDAPSRIYRLDADIHACDWLANHPFDPWRVTAGIAQEDVDTEAAIPACIAAAGERPEEPRFQYQAGRALFYAGRTQEALPYLQRAAHEMDYPQAQFVLGFLKEQALQGVEEDLCEAGLLWRRAALQGLFYAAYSVGKGLLEDRFADCAWHSAPGDALSFLKTAQAQSAFTGLEDEIDGLVVQAEAELNGDSL